MFFLTLKDKSNSYLSDPDVCLMLEFQEGNKASFETLMHKYFPRLLNFIYRYVSSREAAQDLTQEVFIRVYKSGSGYKPQSKFQTWVFTIARNLSLNELRRNKHRTVSLDATFSSDDGEMRRQVEDPNSVSPDEDLLRREKAVAVKAAIDDLPENQRVAVLLRRYEQFSYEEIARTMNISPKAVKSLLSRARESLKTKLAHLLP
ncbi:MAG: sigma-70 family RNA polymerase sigma factor [Candidatus Omnitrophica bacterium]|nr:sigma-70 family RNA polymerase sigma factor [Candidatus Omnitrophota bacterium]